MRNRCCIVCAYVLSLKLSLMFTFSFCRHSRFVCTVVYRFCSANCSSAPHLFGLRASINVIEAVFFIRLIWDV